MSQQGQDAGTVTEIQDAVTAATIAAVQRWDRAVNQHDLDAVMAAMTDDCVFESSYPQPNGTRYEGQEAVRAFWENVFRASPHSAIEAEEIFAAGDRCVFLCVQRSLDDDGNPKHCRAVDVIRVRDGKVAESLSYFKRNPPR